MCGILIIVGSGVLISLTSWGSAVHPGWSQRCWPCDGWTSSCRTTRSTNIHSKETWSFSKETWNNTSEATAETEKKSPTLGMASSSSHLDFLLFLSAEALNEQTQHVGVWFHLIASWPNSTGDTGLTGIPPSLRLKTHLTWQSNSHHINDKNYLFLTTPFLRPRPPSFWARSGKSLEGGLGGTLVLRRKMHFLFFISFPHRNLNTSVWW